jgi:peptide-methionine (S)-S-oxide reductase
VNGGWLARLAVIVTGVSLGTGLLVAGPAMRSGLASSTSPTDGRAIPPPDEDERPAGAETEVAVLAGGCFWGVQGVFQHVDGVINAVSGYAGGEAETAHYDLVGAGTTGHAEAVEITFDPGAISFGQLLHIYFSVAHDPTQLDRQGPDVGPQYRSSIFPVSRAQSRVARAYISQLDQAEVFDAAIATTIESDRVFFPAEDYHQDFMELNPTYPYIVRNDAPKLEALQVLFPDVYRTEPALVGAADSAS